MLIQERNEKWLNFFTPAASIVVGSLLAALVVIPILLIDALVPLLSEDSVIATLSVLFLSQVIGTVLVVFLLIPLLKVKDAEFQEISVTRTLQTGLIFCGSFAIYSLSNLFFTIIFSALKVEPKSGYDPILLTAEHLDNPFNIVLLLGLGAVVGPIFEEYVYRRTLIPLLEERGMAPFAAVLASSLVFTLAHAPNDLLNANMSGTVAHLWAVFIIGMTCGIVYIMTRNVLFPIIIHGLYNGLSFSGYLIMLTEDDGLLQNYGMVILLFLIIGLGVMAYAVWKYKKAPTANWVRSIKEKSSYNIIPGLIGFVVIYVILITILVLVPLSVWELSKNGLLTSITEIVVQVGLFVVLLWLVTTKTEYIGLTKDADIVKW
ncbi:MAG: lysostaphin resistance A-like protein [Candidatus Hodarchaeota archaeon]